MADKNKKAAAAGDAPIKKETKPSSKKEEIIEEIEKTESEIERDAARARAEARRARFKRKWPEITRPEFKTRPWRPPGPPKRMPTVSVARPELVTRRWVPPHRRRRRPRARLARVPPDMVTRPLYECAKLKRIWHNFEQVAPNKMILQGTTCCNSKKYSSTYCDSQTACIAVVARALLDGTAAAQLRPRDVDDVIDAGDKFYKRCMLALKCYKGKPQLKLDQLLPYFYFRDVKYTYKASPLECGVLAARPGAAEPDMMQLIEKRANGPYFLILSVGDRHALVWRPPDEPRACYYFEPHCLDREGFQGNVHQGCCGIQEGAGGFIRYAGYASFVLDFVHNYGSWGEGRTERPQPVIGLTEVEILQKEHLNRQPDYSLDLKVHRPHCHSEWSSMHAQLLQQRKARGEFPLGDLSKVSLAVSRAASKRTVREYMQRPPLPKDAQALAIPPPPVPPEKGPPKVTPEQIMQLRGENFFLYCPKPDVHCYGRDDLAEEVAKAAEEDDEAGRILHSVVDIATRTYPSQYRRLGDDRSLLRGTRHMASHRYQKFKTYTAISCCVAAFAMLRKYRARAWCEDIVDETLDLGFNLFRESLAERPGPIRPLVLGEVKETFNIREREFSHKDKGVAVWGKLFSKNFAVYDLCRGIEAFFKDYDTGVLQIPGEYETGIWNESGTFYLYQPWPADEAGNKVDIRAGGKACVLAFASVAALCDHFLENVLEYKRKPFVISAVNVFEKERSPEPVNNFKPVAPNKWIVRGNFHEGDVRFPEQHRHKQATPNSIAAIAMAHMVEPAQWSAEDVDETLARGDELYQRTIEHLERMGVSLETPRRGEEAEEEEQGTTGTLAAYDVLNRFKITDYDCIETDVEDSSFSGSIPGNKESGLHSLKDSLRDLFKKNRAAVLTARGGSVAIMKRDGYFYLFDPHGCDANGFPSDAPDASACLVRVSGGEEELAAVIEGNLAPGADDSFNLSPVDVEATKLNLALNAPETTLASKQYEWISKGTAAVMVGPRGENTAVGKAARKACVGEEDAAGRRLALPAAAAFCCATAVVPPPHMHRDHMYSLIDAAADYYVRYLKRTAGRGEMGVDDLRDAFELGANTLHLSFDEEPTKMALWMPDKMAGEGGGGEEGGEGEEEEEKIVQMKQVLTRIWEDDTRPLTAHLLLGDYHQLGVWMEAGGRVVVFDPAPTVQRGQLTDARIRKGDELREQRLRDEATGEAEGGDEGGGGEGEEQPEPPPPPTAPPDSAPALMTFASPSEFLDKLVALGGLTPKQALAPYRLYPVTVTNELTAVLRDQRAPSGGAGEAEEEENAEDKFLPALDDAAVGRHFVRSGRQVASLRGRIAQDESYFLEHPNRNNQDAANSVMAIVVHAIEPYMYWNEPMIDAILKYGDRLHTFSLPNAKKPPYVSPEEIVPEFHVSNFDVKLAIASERAVRGDYKAGAGGPVLNMRRGLQAFFESNASGVICSKGHCVAILRAGDSSYGVFDCHAVGPRGRASPAGAAGLLLYSNLDIMAETLRANVDDLGLPGVNTFSITPVTASWELSPSPPPAAPAAAPDDAYELKVLTAYVETGKGRTVLRGSRPDDAYKFHRDSTLRTSCAAVVAACAGAARAPHLWTRRTLDEVAAAAAELFAASVARLGYEFSPREDELTPLQVVKRFVLGVNYVRYDLVTAHAGKLESATPAGTSLRAAIDHFFAKHTRGVLWCSPHAVAVWRVDGAPQYFLYEGNACGRNGLRAGEDEDDVSHCVMTFTNSKLLTQAYLMNIPESERRRREFQLYALSVAVEPIQRVGSDPGLIRPLGDRLVVPATSRMNEDGQPRAAAETASRRAAGGACEASAHLASLRDEADDYYRGQRNSRGWLLLRDGTGYLSAQHSMCCRKFSPASRGYQGVPCCVAAATLARDGAVCRATARDLDRALCAGDRLYRDSYLHFRPARCHLDMTQVLRKFYTPGNCVCRVVVFQPRHRGSVPGDLETEVTNFFAEERCGVLVACRGAFAATLYKTTSGYFVFDPADRDRYGRAVAPQCFGRGRACLAKFLKIKGVIAHLTQNIPPKTRIPTEREESPPSTASAASARTSTTDTRGSRTSSGGEEQKEDKEKPKEEDTTFEIFGVTVPTLRRLNHYER